MPIPLVEVAVGSAVLLTLPERRPKAEVSLWKRGMRGDPEHHTT